MRYFIIVLLFALFFFNEAGAPNINTFQIQITPLNNSEHLQELYLADVDLQNLGTAEDIFQINIQNTNSSLIYNDCILEIDLYRNDQLLISSKSDPFTIPEGFEEKTLTNKEISTGGFDFGGGNIAYFHQVQISPDVESLKNEILSSGKLPFGVYSVSIKLYQLNSQNLLGQNEITLLQVTNPSYIQLISPGVVAGNGLTSNIYSEFPLFQWTGNGSEYQVFVFEKKDMMQSYDDIINSRPNWKSERTDKLSAQYPQTGNAIPLEYGKTYFWMVRMYVQTSGGEKTLDSEVWEFSLVNPEQSGNLQSQMVREDIFLFLGEVLGPQVESVRSSLEGYQLKHIRYNGEEITLNQLYKILNGYRGKSFKIVDFIPPTSER